MSFGREKVMTLPFAGYTYLFHVDNGTTFRNSYAADGSSLHYETVAGAGAGSAETVHLHVAELAPGLYFVSWVEASGMAVSHAMNLTTNTVYAFWSWQGEDGHRQGELHTGKLEQVG
jgi:phenolic acid decarboxylase